MKANWLTTTYEQNQGITRAYSAPVTADSGAEKDTLNLYPSMTYQTIEGFGGAMTEAAAYTYSLMDDKTRQECLEAYFGKDGIGYTQGRMHIDSCDFSLGNYSAVTDPEDTDFQTFSFEREETYILPFLRDAQKVHGGNLTLLLSPWSPPAFMKTNGERNHGGKLKPEYRGQWAKYICRYIREYRKMGLTVRYLTIQNEPKATQTWDSCVYTAEEEKEFLRDFLYPALQENGLADIEIGIWDHNKERMFERACAIIDDETSRMVSFVGFHWYSGDHFDAVRLVQEKFPGKKLIFTEGCVEYTFFNDNSQLQNAQMYAHDILGNLNAGMCAWFDWNVLLDEKGGPNHVGNYCDAPLMYDQSRGKLEKKLSYTYIGHFSRYIKPGAIRIATSQSSDVLETTAFQNPDGSFVCVLLNRSQSAIPLVVRIEGQEVAMEAAPSSITTLFLEHE